MDTVVLEWEYSPPDYFDSPIKIETQDKCNIEIDNGKAVVKIDSVVFDANPLMSDALNHVLKARFIGAQLVRHKKFTLSSPAKTIVHPDGCRDYFLQVEPTRVTVKVTGNQQIFRDGKVVPDPKLDEISFTLRIHKHPNDKVLAKMLRGYSDAVDEPDHELVHLYEIRDAISKKFSDDKKARSALKISYDDWSDLGKLCNEDPLLEGRHHGKHENLHNATNAELSKARKIAKDMIDAYLSYLETSP